MNRQLAAKGKGGMGMKASNSPLLGQCAVCFMAEEGRKQKSLASMRGQSIDIKGAPIPNALPISPLG